MRLAHGTAIVAACTVLSRIGGFGRDVLIAAAVGAGPLGDALLVAMKLPNLLRRLFADGAFASAFVPLYARRLEREGDEAARAFAGGVLAVLAPGLGFVVALGMIGMPAVLAVIAPGFAPGDGRFDPALAMARTTFPYLLMIGLVALAGGILNAHGRFAAAAIAPVLLNLVLIAILLVPWSSRQVAAHAVAWAVPAAGALQLAWAWAALARAGLAPRLGLPRVTPAIRELARVFVPLTLASGTYQINVVVNTILASTLPAGAVAALYFADRLVQLPQGVIGVALGTALLPLLARQVQAGRAAAANETLNRALEAAWLLTVPAAAALVVLRVPIVETLFERGAFDSDATAATALALGAFAAGLPAQVAVRVLGPAFYARAEARAPLLMALVAVVANAGTALLLIGPLGHVGIALATMAAGWLNAALHLGVLTWRGTFRPDPRLLGRLVRIGLATAAMVAVLTLVPPLPLVLTIAAGGVSFAVVATLLGAVRIDELRDLLRRQPA